MFDMEVDVESKCNSVVFSTFAKRATARQKKKDYQSNVIYANVLRKFH